MASEWVGVVGGLIGGVVDVSGAVTVQTLVGRQQATALKSQQAEARRLAFRNERKAVYLRLYRSVHALAFAVLHPAPESIDDRTARVHSASEAVFEQIIEAAFLAGPDVQAKIQQIDQEAKDPSMIRASGEQPELRPVDVDRFTRLMGVADEFRLAAIAEIT